MSLALSISTQKQHVIAIDKAISVNRDGQSYRVINKTCTKFQIVGNTLYFFCGDMLIGETFKQEIAKVKDRSLNGVINLAKSLWEKFNQEDRI
ncbi:hypothetical protein ACQCN2_16150, partial [Brevibacillus ginsengisoli]|uniref:hypothetical protein n=1 Tax=Brevibacillus ginsengisoli TaxID=363854 RepID=UPI003CEF316A